MKHSLEVVVTIVAGAEDEHWATVTGWYEPATQAPLGGFPGDEEPEPASFFIEELTVEIAGRKHDFLPFMTAAQIAAIEQDAINDVSCLPLPPRPVPQSAALSRAMGGGDDLFRTILDICGPAAPAVGSKP
jgi:hypothetical protein